MATDYWKNLSFGLRAYLFFCLLVAGSMSYANHMGWFPTYGIFAGENSMHSNYYHRGYNNYGIHGK